MLYILSRKIINRGLKDEQNIDKINVQKISL